MDLDGIIRELVGERNRLERLIRKIEKSRSTPSAATPSKEERRGRKFMDGPARKEVSERMKRYWAKKREQASAPVDTGPQVSPSGPGCAVNETGATLPGGQAGVSFKAMTA